MRSRASRSRPMPTTTSSRSPSASSCSCNSVTPWPTPTAAGAPLLPDAGLGDDGPTPAADVTALGVVLDRLLAVGVTTAHRRPLRRQVDGTVLKALRRDGQWRYESVEALADDIRRQLETPPARERRDARRTRPATPPRSHVRAVAAWSLAAVAVVALGALMWQLLQRGCWRRP